MPLPFRYVLVAALAASNAPLPPSLPKSPAKSPAISPPSVPDKMAHPQQPLQRLRPASELVALLRKGGLVLLMRHASAPHDPPSAADAAPDNPARERELDAKGVADARAFGAALARLSIPVSRVVTSPAYRVRETAVLAGFAAPETAGYLGHNASPGHAAPPEDLAKLKALVAKGPPDRSGNLLIVTHWPNVLEGWPEMGKGLDEGDLLVIEPGPDDGRVLGAMAITDWPELKVSP